MEDKEDAVICTVILSIRTYCSCEYVISSLLMNSFKWDFAENSN